MRSLLLIASLPIVTGAINPTYAGEHAGHQFTQILTSIDTQRQQDRYNTQAPEHPLLRLVETFHSRPNTHPPDPCHVWQITDDTEPSLAGKSILQYREQCFTTAAIEHPACRTVSDDDLQRVIEGCRVNARTDILFKEREKEKARMAADNSACEQWLSALPENADIITLNLTHRLTQVKGFQLAGDNDPTSAEVINVKVHHPNRLLLLRLKAYNPTIWHIYQSPQTTLAGVAAGGYHKQVVVGLKKDVPLISNSFTQPRCKKALHQSTYMPRYKSNGEKSAFNVDQQNYRLGGKATLYLSEPVDLEALRKPEDILWAGKEGLIQLIKQGGLQTITRAQFSRWHSGARPLSLKSDSNQPMNGHYLITKAITLPDGLFGGYLATFYLPEGVPMPQGDLAHSQLILLDKQNDFLACFGSSCPDEKVSN